MRQVLHDVRNQLAIAIANVEGFRDGIIEPTPARFDAVLQALGEIELLLARAADPEKREEGTA
jgi:hypothetical protein